MKSIFGTISLGSYFVLWNECEGQKLKFISACYSIPDPSKSFKGGEDANHSDSYLLAVCDGVGGWARKGVDVAKYSK